MFYALAANSVISDERFLQFFNGLKDHNNIAQAEAKREAWEKE